MADAGSEAGPGPGADGPPVEPSLGPLARRLLRLAPVAAAPLGVLLFFRGAPWTDVILLPLVLVALPILAVVQALALRGVRIERIPAYASTVLSMVVLATLCAGPAVARGGWAAVGVTPMAWGPFWRWTLLLTGVGLALLLAFRLVAGRLGLAEAPFVRGLLPVSPGEKAAFVGVSVSAGVGEELVFRGYAIGALTPWFGLGGAVALSTASFGVVHAYQGLLGFFRTAALGGILAWGYLATGSLLPAMAAHTLLDVVAGIFLAERLMVPERSSRV